MSDIWHKLPEQPEKGRDVLEKWHHLGIHYTHFIAKNGIAEDNPFTDAWCYLDDLLACEKELADTKKTLDVAVERLKNIVLDAEILATPEYLADRAKETLNQINEITKGGKDEPCTNL